jgi:hypothetical protein
LSTEENKAVVLRFIDEVFVQHDSSNIEELVANESLRQTAPGTVQAFPDLEMTVEQMIAEGDLVAVRVSAAATHKGDFRGIAPTGKGWGGDRQCVVRGARREDQRFLGELGLARDHASALLAPRTTGPAQSK